VILLALAKADLLDLLNRHGFRAKISRVFMREEERPLLWLLSPSAITAADWRHVEFDPETDLKFSEWPPIWLEAFFQRGLLPTSTDALRRLLAPVIEDGRAAVRNKVDVAWAHFLVGFEGLHPLLAQLCQSLPARGTFSKFRSALAKLWRSD